MSDKLLSILGLARRAGRLKAGYDLSVETVRAGKATLVAAAADISEKTFKNLAFEAGRMGVPAVRLPESMDALGAACGIRAGVIALTDSGFAEAIARLAEADRKSGDF